MSRCPSLQQLENLLEQRLEAADSQTVSFHVSGCGRCQAALERLTAQSLVLNYGSLAQSAAASAERAGAISDSQAAFLRRLKQIPPSSGQSGSQGRERVQARRLWNSRDTVMAPPVIDGYEILDELGRGGMGVVYRARQEGLNRLVALKMILAGAHAGPKDLARFRQEAEAVARLRHPNIVQIYDIGEAGGNPYFALEFMEGGSLVQKLRGDPQPLLPAVRLIETLARAIHFAHQHRVIHRDLKPANILLGDLDDQLASGETPLEPLPDPALSATDVPVSSGARGRSVPPLRGLGTWLPKITDFGLAKRLDEPSTKTQSGEIVGTPSYMAPEQAGGKNEGVGPATDVYALGAVLYELLTGRPPFKGATALDTVLQVLHEEPVRPRSLRPDLPRDLETICLKCLAKEAGRRYASAQALADDLHCFRRGKPIRARPIGLHERAWKWAKHRPVIASLLLAIFLVSWLGFAAVTWQWQETRAGWEAALAEEQEKDTQRLEAERARAEAEDQRQHARGALYYSRIVQSQLYWRVNDLTGARNSLEKCVPREGQRDRRGWEWYYLQGLFHSDLLTLGHREVVGSSGAAVYGPDGQWILSVVGGHPPEESDKAGEICIWDAESGEPIRTVAGPGTWSRLALRPDGQRLVVAGTDGWLRIIESPTGRELFRREAHAQAVAGLAFSLDGRFIASTGADGLVRLWDGETGEMVRELKGHDGVVQCVSYHPSGKLLATGGWDATVKIWDVAGGRVVETLRGHKSEVYCVAFSPDGRFVASAGSNGNLRIWEATTWRGVQSLTGHSGAVLGIAYSPDGRYLAYGSGDATVRIWDLESGVERVVFRGHTGPVESVSFSPDGRRLVSFGPGHAEVKVWDLTRHPEYATFARTVKDVEGLAFSEDGRQLLSVTVGGKLQTWDAGNGVLLGERALPVADELISPAVPASFARGGGRLAVRWREDPRLVKVWDTETGRELVTLRGHTLPVSCVRFEGDGHRLVTCACRPRPGDDPHEVKVWDAESGDPMLALTGNGRIFNALFSADGRWLVWGGQAGAVTVVNLEGDPKPRQHVPHVGEVTALAFDPDGQYLATGGLDDRKVKIWRQKTSGEGEEPRWRPVRTLAAPSSLCDLVFSPDGSRLAGISRDGITMWVVETGQEVLSLQGAPQRHFDPAFNPRVLFSPDGRRLAGTNWDESISLWEAPLETEEERVEHRRARCRAADERAHLWHLQEAEHCVLHKNPSAARFHMECLRGAEFTEPLQSRKQLVETRLRSLVAPGQ